MYTLENVIFTTWVRLLASFAPITLFDKISHLDWYQNLLENWAKEHRGEYLRVLDAGCATGYLSQYLHANGAKVVGIDQSASMIQKARSRSSSIDYRVEDATDLSFPSNTFDRVLCASLVNIVPNAPSLLEELVRVCGRGGEVSVLFPTAGNLDKEVTQYIESKGLSGFSAAALLSWHKLAPKKPASDIYLMMENAGLTDITQKTYLNGFITTLSGLKR